LGVFATHNCLIITQDQTIDFNTPEGWLTGGLFTILAGHEKMEMRRKIQAAKENLRRSGKCPSGPQTLPRGLCYSRKEQKFYYDPATIGSVQEAFRLVDSGINNLAEVARRVGIKRTALRGILTNESYIGFRVYTHRRDSSVKNSRADGRQADRPKVPRGEDVIRSKIIDSPAVTTEQFARVAAILAESRRNHLSSLPKERRVHLCTTYGRCGFCGEPIYVATNSRRDKNTGEPFCFYCCKSQHPAKKGKLPRCRNSWVSKRNLDSLVVAFCEKVLGEASLLAQLISDSINRSSQIVRPFPVEKFQETIAKLKRKERHLIEMCAAEAISIAELKAEREKINAEIARLRNSENDRPKHRGLSVQQLARLLIKGALGFRRAERREQKQILEHLFSEIFFKGQSIRAFRLHPSISGLASDSDRLSQTIYLPDPFRITPEIPVGQKQCSRCAKILPAIVFRKGRSLCPECNRVNNRYRSRRYRDKQRQKI